MSADFGTRSDRNALASSGMRPHCSFTEDVVSVSRILTRAHRVGIPAGHSTHAGLRLTERPVSLSGAAHDPLTLGREGKGKEGNREGNGSIVSPLSGLLLVIEDDQTQHVAVGNGLARGPLGLGGDA